MSTSSTDSFDLVETTVADIHAAMADGHVTAEALVDRYLTRIEVYDTDLNAVLTVNDNARGRAHELDKQFENDGFTGPLHGIPVALKDNQDTQDMPTTAGSVALAESTPPRDAYVVAQLRAAGAIVVAKTNLQELSFGLDTISSLGGATRNAYKLDYRPSGSSGGTAAALAANLATLGTGSDTCSSLRSPPAFNNLVGVRPTGGLVSRTVIVPLSETQDTAGPVARTVADAARVLEVIAGNDPADPATASAEDRVPKEGYRSHLDPDGLEGARIGVVRQFFGLQSEDSATATDAAKVTSVVEEAIDAMGATGATVVDPVEVVDVGLLESARVIEYEFARDFGRYLSELGDATPHDSLADIYETGTITPSVESRLESSDILEIDIASLDENADYLRRLRRQHQLAETTLSRLDERDIDALLYPPSAIPPVEFPHHQPFSEMNCELSAHTGLPAIVVPAGFTEDGLPVGVELLGRRFAEPRLFELAYNFEQTTDHRRPPERFGELERK